MFDATRIKSSQINDLRQLTLIAIATPPRVCLEPNLGIAISAEGHVKATSSEAHKHVPHVALTDDKRQLTYTPQEFGNTYGWKKIPRK